MTARVLLTGFEPFAGWSANPSGDVAQALGRDPALRRAGVATALLPVHRTHAPARLVELLRRLRPEALVLTGLAAGRTAICLERIAINCWKRPSIKGASEGVRIDRAGPDGLFSTLPLTASLAALRAGGAPARMSDSAGTYCCNLVLYQALRWAEAGELPGGGPSPRRVGFVHLPATTESLPPGRCEPCLAQSAIADGLAALVRSLAGPAEAPRNVGSRSGRRSR